MTKSVRIENADTSNHQVIVETWSKREDGDVLVSSKLLDYPTALGTFWVFKEQYLIVKEK